MSSGKRKKIPIESGWGERIMQIRLRNRLNQAEFAKKLGLGASGGFISEVENERKLPGWAFLYSLKRVFGVSIDWLFSGVVDGVRSGDIQAAVRLAEKQLLDKDWSVTKKGEYVALMALLKARGLSDEDVQGLALDKLASPE